MRAQAVAGWVAIAAGFAFVAGVLVAAVGPGVVGMPTAAGGPFMPMGPAMMAGPGRMGVGGIGGMMGFGNAGPAATAIPGAPEVRVEARNFSFSPTDIRLRSNEDVNLTLTNPAATGVIHDLTVPALGIHLVANAAETRTIGLRGIATGRYDAYCSVPGHAELGMRAVVVAE